MTVQAGATPIDMEPVVRAEPLEPPRGQTMADRVVRTVLARPVTKMAVGWIATLAALAVVAPLLANSSPWFAVVNGKWSFPLLATLDWSDWTFFVTAVALVGMWRVRSIRTRDKFLVAAGVVFVTAFSFYVAVNTRANPDYSTYRRLASQGKVRWALNTLIPYSASDRLIDQSAMDSRAPSRQHWMGTEQNQADVASRLLHACRTAVSIGLISVGISICIGVVVGGLMGYFAGVADLIGMRLIEMFEAIPTLILMITLVAFFPGESYRFFMLMGVIGATNWTGFARYLRAEFLKLRKSDFVQSAVASGLSTPRVVFGHILPNALSPVLVAASFAIAGAIVSESTLSFLGLGTIDQPSWGGILTQSLGEGGEFHWWLAVFPGVAIFLTVLAYNRLGEAIADALDPKGG